MQIHVGFEMIYDCPQPTPMIFNLNVHFTRVSDLVGRDDLVVDPPVPRQPIVTASATGAPALSRPRAARASGPMRSSTILASPTPLFPRRNRFPCRTCPRRRLSSCSGAAIAKPIGYRRRRGIFLGRHQRDGAGAGICDYVHRHLTFGYEHARMTRTALEAFYDRTGVCRDFTHLAVAFCRCMSIPARYCTGTSVDIGVPPVDDPMDFSAWFEVFLGGQWHTFDARHNTPRIGRVLIARGRDAADVALSNTFGPNTLTSFRVWADEVPTG